jgi:hypothetical protein
MISYPLSARLRLELASDGAGQLVELLDVDATAEAEHLNTIDLSPAEARAALGALLAFLYPTLTNSPSGPP